MIRIGVDFGGTKIEAAALDADGPVRGPRAQAQSRRLRRGARDGARAGGRGGDAGRRQPAPRSGVGVPGSLSPQDRPDAQRQQRLAERQAVPARTWQQALGRPVRLENDANCFALSEAHRRRGARAPRWCSARSSAPAAAAAWWCDGRPIEGVNGIGGEWGHTPLPWPSAEERAAPHLLVRPQRLPGDLDLRHRLRARLRARDRRDADRRRDRRAGARRRGRRRGGARPLRRPAGPRRWR